MPQRLATINVSLPKKLRADIERKIKREAYGSISEYVRELIRKDLRAQAIDQVDSLLLDGLRSGTPRRVDEDWWRERKAVITRRRA
jgi:putative addiction module CopG family antidote